ncbi:phage tail protein [Metapseudomonas resinovorans]|uniref:phage tail protein n=1 Tax=Metapseudomonas resinovorans TaxID=53412 RepID=UPI00048B5AD9|nr:phage tail protein [Pseudomonas resinovorans]
MIGFFVGGPAGAAIGFGIGLSAGGMLDPVKGPSQPGPQINDKNFQTAKYGDMLTRFYGTIPVHGNVTWIENGALKVTIRKKKSGGKGGSAKAAPVAYYSATFFLSLGIGSIAGIRRIWCSDKLIYNAGSDDLETIIASNQAATGFKVYLGTDDQLPDPRYEADVGVGNAPAYRGEAYLAFYDFPLADYGNSLQGAQFKVEVVTDLTVNGVSEAVQGVVGVPFVQGNAFASCASAYMMGPSLQSYVNITKSSDGTNPLSYELVTAFKANRSLVEPRTITTDFFNRASPLAGDADGPSFGYGYGASVTIDGAAFPLPTLGYYPGSCRYCKRGSRAWLIAYESPPRVHSLTSSVSYTDSGARHITSDGGVLYVLRADGTIDERHPDTLALIQNHSVGLPSTGWQSALTGDVDGIMHRDGKLYVLRAANRTIYEFDGWSIGKSYVLPFTPIAANSSWGVGNGAVAFLNGETAEITYYLLQTATAELVPLSSIVEQEVELSSLLSASDLDASLLTADVRGYRVSGGSIRSALEPLQGAFPFDIIQSGYQLKCVPRGQASVMTIPWEDLGASDGDTPGDLLKESREMDTQLPALVSIKYLDAAREYAIGEQSKPRINTQAINRVDRDLALVMTADEAAQMADILVNLPWLERTPASFSLPPTYLALEPADVVTVVAPWATFELRLTEGNYTPSGRTEWEAKPNRAALYTSTAKGGEGVEPDGTIGVPGPSIFLPLDIPMVDETVQNSPGFVGAMTGYSPAWPGGIAFRSVDSGQIWNELQGFDGQATLGTAAGILPASTGALIDQRSLSVSLVSGELESISRDQMLVGQNYAAYGTGGRWEIIRFQTAALQPDGSYLLSGFVRGDRGTEWATGLHQLGDWFVLLDDPDNLFIDTSVGSIGVATTFRGVTSGATIDSAVDVPFTYQGINLKCLSPVYAKGVRDGSSNFSGTFTRRSRFSSSWWSNGVEAPIGETTQAYEIDVMSGSTVKRTITASTPNFSYSAADQVTDFGSAPASITFRIYELSATVGRGLPLEVTL